MSIVRYRCPCGKVFPVPRPEGERRPKGHIKDIWCVTCIKVTKHQALGAHG